MFLFLTETSGLLHLSSSSFLPCQIIQALGSLGYLWKNLFNVSAGI